MDVLALILLVVALLCFLVAAFGRTFGSINLVALGLALWILAVILGTGINISVN